MAYPLGDYGSDPPDAAPDAAQDAAADARQDTGADVSPNLRCGALFTCTPPGEVCCGAPGNFACKPAAGTCAQTRIACDDGTACAAGAVCCAFRDGGVISDVRCALPAACITSDAGIVLCDPSDSTGCATGGTCRTATESGLPLTSTYYECR